MRFGKYSGKRLKDVPKDYLLWMFQHLSEKRKMNPMERDLWNYINENKEEIENRST